MQEIIADMYASAKEKDRVAKVNREGFRKEFPKTWKVIKRELKHFKPELEKEKW